MKKLEESITAADQLHANDQVGANSKWNFRIHIIEIIDAR